MHNDCLDLEIFTADKVGQRVLNARIYFMPQEPLFFILKIPISFSFCILCNYKQNARAIEIYFPQSVFSHGYPPRCFEYVPLKMLKFSKRSTTINLLKRGKTFYIECGLKVRFHLTYSSLYIKYNV